MKRALAVLLLVSAGAQAQDAPPLEQAIDPPGLPQGEPVGHQGDLDQVIDSVDRLLSQSQQQARQALARKDYPAALAALERAHELAPADVDTTVRLADLLALVGNLERAERLYREALAADERRADARIALADLIVRTGEDADLSEASELLSRARELLGNRADLILRQARVEARRGRFELAERAYEAYRGSTPLDDPMRLELGDFYRDFGQPETALEWYRQVGGGQDGAAARAAAQRIFALDVEREARRYGFAPDQRKAPQRLKTLLPRARALSAEGAHEEARAILEEAIALAPTHGESRAALAEVLAAAGERDAAELSYLRALAFDPRPEVERGLAELYLSDPSGRMAAHAAVLLERVLARRPDWSELHLTLARALQRSGELPRALLHARRFVAQAGPGPQKKQAEALAQELTRLLGAGGGVPGGAAASAARSGELPALSQARAHLSRGEVEAALAALREHDERSGGTVETMMLRARILHGAGRLAEARRVLEALIGRDRHQAEAHALLGRVLRASDDPHVRQAGRAALAEAERLGDMDASLELARMDLADDRGEMSWLYDGPRLMQLLHGRERVARLAGEASGPTRNEAAALMLRAGERLRALALAALLVVLLGLVVLLWMRQRFLGGGDLARLIEAAPEAGPELMTILSAVQHEVLKHNTMMLTGLCEALARGDDAMAAADQASHLRKALLGTGGAADRLDGYVEQLEQLGRAHGLRLNLARRDDAVGALLDGFAVLDSVDKELGKVAKLSARRRRALLSRLGEASELLNGRGADGVRALLDRVRTLEVDAALLREIHDRIGAEPVLAERALSPLSLEGEAALPCRVRLPRQVFEDVLANLMRNALQAMARGEAQDALGLGLSVEAGRDPITGLSEVAFHVRDRAPEDLANEQLRRRYIEAGLGLTADLVSRYEGSLEVSTEEAGWTKAVVLRVPGESVSAEVAS